MNRVVNLERFWLPTGKSYSLTTAGWLSDPNSEGLWRANADALATRALADRQCVVLLGEPGMGKSSALDGGRALLPQVEALENQYVDLGVYAGEDRLVRSVFESQVINKWQAGSHRLCLTLDGFDEALNRIETLDRLLTDYLARWDRERLFIRLVCRTADWRQSLRAALVEGFGDANVHELLPLRRSDAGLLLRAAGLDPEEILAAVEQTRIVPLAARPLTLNLIRSSIGPGGSLPDNAGALYQRGLTALLDEMNPERRGSIRPPGGVASRMLAAKRIAALSLFGDRPTVWTGPVAEALPDDLTVDECLGTQESSSPGISSDDVASTLRSGIFAGAGEGRLTWSHATFADFLSARWILDEELNDKQVSSLLVANGGRIHARMRQVAAWLVGLDPLRFRELIRSDPQAFLASVDLPEEALRAEVVRALLQDAETGQLFDDFQSDYSGLYHSGLAEQLRPALEAGQGERCRVAIRIARQCSSLQSVPDLTALALNDDADPHVRASAAMAVHDLSPASPSHDLVTLIGPTNEPPTSMDTRELEAAALLASWPHAVSTETVFSVLSPSRPRSYRGLYSSFVDHFASGLEDADLEPACAWILDDISRVDDSRLTSITTAILRLCIANLDNDRAREVVTTVAFRRIDEYQPPFGEPDLAGEQITMDVGVRRAVCRLLLAMASEEQVWSIVYQSGPGDRLIDDDDLEWLIDVYVSSDGVTRVNAGRAAQTVLRSDLVSHSDVVLGLADDHPAAGLFAYWRTPVEFDSEAAVAARTQWYERSPRGRERKQAGEGESADQWVNPRIAENIAKVVAGEASAFWYAARLVTVKPGTQRHMNEYQPDLTLHPRWETLPAAVRSDFVLAAASYVENGKCEPERWLAQNLDFYPARAGYRALVLLLRLAPDTLEAVAPAAWREWAPILVAWTATVNGASEEDKRRLLALARPHADEELRAAMLALVDQAIADGSYVFLRTEFDALSSETLAGELVDRLVRPMAADTRSAILDFLVERHSALVTPVLSEWLNDAERSEDPDRAQDAVRRLLWHDAAGSWTKLRALMGDDAPFMEAALSAGANAFAWHVPNLLPPDMADLYLWLFQRFPADEDPTSEDAHRIGSREALGTWRDALLNALTRAGTREAVAAVEQIAQSRPDEPWLARVLVDAKRALRDQSWEPLTPRDVDQLAQSRHAHIVRSDADLLAATLGALDEIQARLQADTPAAYLLWDTYAGRPKSEEEISDYLAIELQQRLNARGVVVNREVQVRRSRPAGLPERTDLRVEALRPDQDSTSATGTLRIPAEVKGIWNREVIDSLDTQLVQRYMADFQTDHGVYIVAWFDPEPWTTSDGRRGTAAPRGGIAEVRATLGAEAERQLARGRVVAVRVLDCSLKRPIAT
ncbi:NACHT domain-containing protein [Jiangella alba]|nr:hypothetical protein [Jiangella alba]